MWSSSFPVFFFFSIPGSPSESDIKVGDIDEVSYLQRVLFGAPGVFCQCGSLGLISAVSMLPCMGGRTAEHVGFVGLSHVGSQPFFLQGFSP